MLTDRGRYALALGGGTYLAAWFFGSDPLYPIAIGLVVAVAAAWLWVRVLAHPVRLRRVIAGGSHVDGDDVPVELELEVEGGIAPGILFVEERIERLGNRSTELTRRHDDRAQRGTTTRGRYVIPSVPRGRYPIETGDVAIDDPFGFVCAETVLRAPGALLVYPRLVELSGLFSESGSRLAEGRRLLLRRPSGFDLHGVREHQQGESLRRVHWPSTAKRSQLMVKELEDAPRDEVLVVLDADGSAVAGEGRDTTFELVVRAAGSIVKAHAGRGRRAGLLVNGATPRHQPVHSLDGDWNLALELLAAVEPDGRHHVASLLNESGGPTATALDLTVVTSSVTARLVDRLLQRSISRWATALVFVDPASFAASGDRDRPLLDVRAQLARLGRAGVPVAVVARGDDLAAKIGFPASVREEAVG